MPLSRLSAARGIAARTAAARTYARTAAARTSARGGIGALTAARGGSSALTASRVGSGALTAARGGSGAGRGFASFEENGWWKKFTPSEGTLKLCAVLGGIPSICGSISYGYWKMAGHVEAKSKAYVDGRLVEFKTFQNVATGTHHETVRQFNEAIHELKSKVLAMEQKEFEHKKELVIAAEILRKHQAELAAAAAAK